MLNKIALAAALIASTASLALAEGDSTIGIYSPYAQQSAAPTFTGRNVALGGQVIVRDVQNDRASSPYAGGGF